MQVNRAGSHASGASTPHSEMQLSRRGSQDGGASASPLTRSPRPSGLLEGLPGDLSHRIQAMSQTPSPGPSPSGKGQEAASSAQSGLRSFNPRITLEDMVISGGDRSSGGSVPLARSSGGAASEGFSLDAGGGVASGAAGSRAGAGAVPALSLAALAAQRQLSDAAAAAADDDTAALSARSVGHTMEEVRELKRQLDEARELLANKQVGGVGLRGYSLQDVHVLFGTCPLLHVA